MVPPSHPAPSYVYLLLEMFNRIVHRRYLYCFIRTFLKFSHKAFFLFKKAVLPCRFKNNEITNSRRLMCVLILRNKFSARPSPFVVVFITLRKKCYMGSISFLKIFMFPFGGKRRTVYCVGLPSTNNFWN